MSVPKKARSEARGVATKKTPAKKVVAVSATTVPAKKEVTKAKKTTPAPKVEKKAASVAPKKAVKKATSTLTPKKVSKEKEVESVTINTNQLLAKVEKRAKTTAAPSAKKETTVKKGSVAYKRTAMKMAAQLVKGSGRKNTEREKKLEALLKRNGFAEPVEEVSIETSYRVGETDKGITLFSRVKTGEAVILTARVFGLSFVVLGAFFTILTINRVVNSGDSSILGSVDRQLAQLINNTSTTTVLDPTVQSMPAPQPPQVNFMLPGGQLTGSVPLRFSVPADGVVVSVRHMQTQQWHKLGYAQSNDKVLWTLDWDTTNHLPGDYVVQVVVKSNGGTFPFNAPQQLTVVHPLPTDSSSPTNSSTTTTLNTTGTTGTVTNTTTNTTNTATTSTTQTTSTSFSDIRFAMVDKIPSPLINTRTFAVKATGVQSLTFEAIHSDTKARVSLGGATPVDVDVWRMTIDTALLENAKYLLRVHARTNAGVMVSGTPLSFTVDKGATLPVASTTPTQTTTTSTPSTASTSSPLRNKAVIKIDSSSPVSGSAQLFAEADAAIMTEFYARPAGSLKDIFLGRGARVSATTWRLSWDTRQTPNGAYTVFSRHQNEFGRFDSQPISVEIKNIVAPTLTPEQQASIEEMKAISGVAPSTPELIKTTLIDPLARVATTTEDADEQASDEDTNDEEDAQPIDEEPERILKEVYTRFEGDIDELLREYTRRLRDGDEAGIAEIQRRIEVLTSDMTNSLVGTEVGDPVAIKKRIEDDLSALTQEVQKTQEIVKARVGDAVVKDSDKDGVTDYDELTFFKTNPFSADTDGDGFNDDAEITSGFDPTNPAREVAIAYESPKETGVVREDILEVSGIATLPPDEVTTAIEGETETTIAPPAAIITGKALPNSFVTIYIFSTPIIVTVKTNEDGSWSYRFDKELEDGEHEVFVGVTDNAGKIVAKSNPFKFVKEAQAFTPVDTEAALVTTSDAQSPSFFSQQALIIAMGGVVIALGLILLMISVYIVRRPRPEASTDLAHGA